MYTLHTNLNLLKCHGKGVRKRVNNHKVDHSTGVLNCRNSDAKENTTILQGFAEQEEDLIQGEITHSKKKKNHKIQNPCKPACFISLWYTSCMHVWKLWLYTLGTD